MLEQPTFPRHASPSAIAPGCLPLSPLLIYPISQPLLLTSPSFSRLPIHLNHCQTCGLGEDPSKAKNPTFNCRDKSKHVSGGPPEATPCDLFYLFVVFAE